MKSIVILSLFGGASASWGCDATIETLKWGPNNWKSILDDTSITQWTDDGSTSVNGVAATLDSGFDGEDTLYDTNSNVALDTPSTFAANYISSATTCSAGKIKLRRMLDIEPNAELWQEASKT